jgi:hypothetical protein
MKTLLLIGMLLGQQAPAMKCVEWKPQTKTVCEKSEDHTLGGAAVGWLLLGPVGGIAGAILGHDDKQVCHEETVGDPVCTKYAPAEKTK